MLLSRNKRTLRIYLTDQQVLADSNSGVGQFQFDAESAERGLVLWLADHASELSNVDVEVEFSGALSMLFCLPFSPAMNSPASILRIAEAYAKTALGKHSPEFFSVAEPLKYGRAAVIVALRSGAGFTAQANQLPRHVKSVQAYALASWNRHANQLPIHPCWLVVGEPTTLTFFYSHAQAIEDAFTLSLSSGGDYCQLIKRTIKQQFHRQSSGIFIIDEFNLFAEDVIAEFDFLVLNANGFSSPCNESSV